MFYSTVSAIAGRVSEMVDDMLLGDFEYVIVGERLFADVDAAARCADERLHTRPPVVRPCAATPPCLASPVTRAGSRARSRALCRAGARAARRERELG